MAKLSDYLPHPSESTSTLDEVTTEGNVTTNAITVGNLTSTGIDDNATSTAITIDASENVGIDSRLRVGTGNADSRITLNNEGTEQTNDSNFIRGVNGGLIYNAAYKEHKWEIAGTEAMRIDSSGNVGIGTAPQSEFALKVDGSINAVKNIFTSLDSTSNVRAIEMYRGGDGVTTGAKCSIRSRGDGLGNATELSFETNDTVNLTLDASGNLTATGNVTAYSDERLKENIETLDGSKVYDMRGVSFTKDGEAGSGVIAQELQKVAPELVHEGEEYLSVAYGNLVGYLIEAVKDLKAEVEELKGAK